MHLVFRGHTGQWHSLQWHGVFDNSDSVTQTWQPVHINSMTLDWIFMSIANCQNKKPDD